MVCRDFILPEFCKPCLFLSSIQFAQLILHYLAVSPYLKFYQRIYLKSLQKENKYKQKKRQSKDCRSVLALPIFPGRRQPSIVGRSELNYRVRNGNGWTLTLINTNFVFRVTGELFQL